MIRINIPNIEPIVAEHLVLDYNGTLAIDGQLIGGVSTLLNKLSENLSVHVITADTFGTVEKTFANTKINLKILGGKEQGRQKADFVTSLNHNRLWPLETEQTMRKCLSRLLLVLRLYRQRGHRLRR